MSSSHPSSVLPLFFGSGLIAILDGLLLSASTGVSILAATISFNLLGAWLICGCIALLLISFMHHAVFRRAAFGMGLVVGAMPLLHSFIPFPYVHLVFILLLVAVVFVCPIKQPSTKLCGIGSLVMTVLMLTSFMIPHELPAHPLAPLDVAKTNAQAPDVILISVDTLRADAVYDQQQLGLNFPTLSTLRQESLWADYALSSSNQTLPGHMGMLSGLSATRHGVRSNRDLPDVSIPLAADYFARAGFQTSAVISNALLSSATGMHYGFDVFSDEAIGLARLSMMSEDYLAQHSWLSMLLQASRSNRLFRKLYYRHKFKATSLAEHCTDIALQQLDAAYAKPTPLFQFIHLMDPHTNYAPPATARGVISAALAPQIDSRYLPSTTAEISVSMVRDVQHQVQQATPGADLAASYYHQVYLEEVLEVDRQLQRIIAKLDSSGRDYVLLLTADHGEQFAEHGLMDHANSLYEENIRVPFMLSASNINAAQIDGVPQLCDVLPTLLHYANIEFSDDAFDGQVVTATIAPRPHVAVDQKEIAVRDMQGLKWIGAWQADNSLPIDVKLFDLADGEDHNLIADKQQLTSQLRSLIDDYFENDTYAARQTNAKTSAAQQAALNSLGYAGQEDDR
ncbi:MAG: arylsulfatase A-like enzyme [Myxococcota bacterium]|jgi:arylsulfatase A-like enzyme